MGYIAETSMALADSWRWWTAPGAALGLFLLFGKVNEIYQNEIVGDINEQPILPAAFRITGLISMGLFLLGCLVLGAAIPALSDNRFLDPVTATMYLKPLVAGGWLLWGIASWGVAISFAKRRLFMIGSCIVTWIAALTSSLALVGAV